ncbi:GPR1/FUN34/yaaH family-domain-containing protein [Verticillium dahliae]|nr:GPR1/FUN34/yaaH family-domain-containing protein [Verticillium dahliae]
MPEPPRSLQTWTRRGSRDTEPRRNPPRACVNSAYRRKRQTRPAVHPNARMANATVFVGNLCFIAGVGLLVSAQWEMVRGNTFGYTVLSSFGLYYAGYGVLRMPGMGIIEAYGGYTAEYYNAVGLYLLGEDTAMIMTRYCSGAEADGSSLVHTQLLLPARLSGHVRPPNPPSPGKNGIKQLTRKSPGNVPNIIIFAGLEFSFLFNCAAHFAMADGDTAASAVAAASGFYMVGYELCRDVFPFELPVGDTSRFFGRRKLC